MVKIGPLLGYQEPVATGRAFLSPVCGQVVAGGGRERRQWAARALLLRHHPRCSAACP